MSEKRNKIISEKEKYIYNTYLRVHRSKQNKPFKYRRDFSKFDETEHFVYIKRLGNFFNKFNHINIDKFFGAPYGLYPDDNTIYDLRFYASPRAIKVYSLYLKSLDQADPDSEHHIQYVKDSLLYIYKYCLNKKINVNDYINEKSGDIPTFVLHLRDRYISIYSVIGIEPFDLIMHRIPNDRLNFTVGENFISQLDNFRTQYKMSTKLKTITEKGIKQINKLLLTAKSS